MGTGIPAGLVVLGSSGLGRLEVQKLQISIVGTDMGQVEEMPDPQTP